MQVRLTIYAGDLCNSTVEISLTEEELRAIKKVSDTFDSSANDKGYLVGRLEIDTIYDNPINRGASE